MPLTRDFKETILADMQRDPGFREAMLREGIDALFNDEFELAKEILRDYINATLGFEELSKNVNIPAKSLMRMLGPKGNPQASNLLAVIGALRRHANVEFHVVCALAAKAKRVEMAERALIQGRRERDPSDKMAKYTLDLDNKRTEFAEATREFKRR